MMSRHISGIQQRKTHNICTIKNNPFYGFSVCFIYCCNFPVLDSFFKIPSGVLDGDIIWPGQYDECIKINQAFNDRLTYNMTFLIHGKYFLAALLIPVDLVSNNSFRTN